MKQTFIIVALIIYSTISGAQPAEIEIQRPLIFECAPTFSATDNQLLLYREPDMRSQSVVIPYQVGWRIPAPRSEGRARILSIGSLRVIELDSQMYCPVLANDAPPTLVAGELVDYLHMESEGWGKIRVGGAECLVRSDVSFGLFELVKEPLVQRWLRVYFADGTSPGWLLNDGTQTHLSCGG